MNPEQRRINSRPIKDRTFKGRRDPGFCSNLEGKVWKVSCPSLVHHISGNGRHEAGWSLDGNARIGICRPGPETIPTQAILRRPTLQMRTFRIACRYLPLSAKSYSTLENMHACAQGLDQTFSHRKARDIGPSFTGSLFFLFFLLPLVLSPPHLRFPSSTLCALSGYSDALLP
jgi:hypothetical protein